MKNIYKHVKGCMISIGEEPATAKIQEKEEKGEEEEGEEEGDE